MGQLHGQRSGDALVFTFDAVDAGLGDIDVLVGHIADLSRFDQVSDLIVASRSIFRSCGPYRILRRSRNSSIFPVPKLGLP